MIRLHEREPLRVAYGGGVNSTAMLVGLRRLDVVPDAICMADTGIEHPDTYAYVREIMAPWLKANGLPPVTIVRKRSPRTGDRTLYAECWRKHRLPSASYGRHSCADKWKIRPQQYFDRRWPPAVDAWKQGRKVIVAIGYDAGRRDGARTCNAMAFQAKSNLDMRRYRYWHPLVEWGWDRDECVRQIESELLPAPASRPARSAGTRRSTNSTNGSGPPRTCSGTPSRWKIVPVKPANCGP